MRRLTLACLLVTMAAPAFAQTEKEISCDHQANVVAAIQQARLNGVRERKVAERLSVSPAWPEKYNKIIPLLAPHIYEIKRSDLKTQDLRAWWKEQCLAL